MTKKHTLLFLASIALVATVYYRIRVDELNLTTGLVFLAAIALFGYLMLETALALWRPLSDRANKLRLLLATISVLVCVLELFLRYGVDDYATYWELSGRSYRSLFHQTGPSWFHTNPPYQELTFTMPEFTYTRSTNSLGLSESEIDSTRLPGEYRVIALGDSFTEGVGTPYDSTWVKAVERHLSAAFPSRLIRTINAGISGSDVFFEYILLRERLLAFDPDLVIIATNATDVGDLVIRGGFERFQPDGSLVTRSAPPWEWIFGISYIARFFIQDVLHYNWLFIRERHMPAVNKMAMGEIRTAIDSVVALAAQEGFEVLVVVHPASWEASQDQWTQGFDSLIAGLERDAKTNVLDLLEYYRVNEITSPANAADLFWPLDGHYNSRGYAAMGKAVAKTILDLRLLGPT